MKQSGMYGPSAAGEFNRRSKRAGSMVIACPEQYLYCALRTRCLNAHLLQGSRAFVLLFTGLAGCIVFIGGLLVGIAFARSPGLHGPAFELIVPPGNSYRHLRGRHVLSQDVGQEVWPNDVAYSAQKSETTEQVMSQGREEGSSYEEKLMVTGSDSPERDDDAEISNAVNKLSRVSADTSQVDSWREPTKEISAGAQATGNSSSADLAGLPQDIPRQGRAPAFNKTSLQGVSLDGKYYAELTSSMDAPAVTVSAWIYLDSESASNTINTIMTNKGTGCETTPHRMGFALYVNTWESADRQVIIEWGNGQSGCVKLCSGQSGTVIEYDKWAHIVAVLASDRAILYIDAKQVASSEPVDRVVQRSTNLKIGQHDDNQYPFFGRIAAITIFHEALSRDDVLQLLSDSPLQSAALVSHPHLAVALPLNEPPSQRREDKSLRDMYGKSVGSYRTDSIFDFIDDLQDGIPPTAQIEVTPAMRAESDEQARGRRVVIQGAMQRVWRAYEEHAWGRDELKPISLVGQDNWGGIGCTLVDSLDTLWLMGLKQEFAAATEWVRQSLSFAGVGDVSVFETTIRELGGLLSAYDLSGERVFLDKARELGTRMMGAFDTPSGIPMGHTNLHTRKSSHAGWTGGAAILAELGSLQIEFRYLSEKTGDPSYAQKVNKVFDLMADRQPSNGLYPIYVSTDSGHFQSGQITFGALGDSFYEYALKVWLQGGKQEPQYRRMFDDAMDGMMRLMLKRSQPSGMLYIADLEGGQTHDKMDHLACFLPAVLALGAATLDDKPSTKDRRDRYMRTAQGLTHTCYQMYHRQPTHLSPEYVNFFEGQDMVGGANFYILRPEVAEALFYLHELTGHPIYREWAWEIFQGIEKHCHTEHAYGAYPDVTSTTRGAEDRMESFFLAETLKYLYLIQDPDHPLDLVHGHVFNTEAHPLRVFSHAPGRPSPITPDTDSLTRIERI